MNYWHMQMHLPWGRGKGSIDSRKLLLEEKPVIGIGSWENFQFENFQGIKSNSLQIGHIILIREGKTPIALCKVLGECFNDEELEEKYHCDHFREVEVLDWYTGKEDFPIPTGTLQRLVNKKSDSWKFIDNWFQKLQKHTQMKEIIDLLKYKHQIILQGPPGTGKTRLAKLVAAELTRSKKQGRPIEKIEKFLQNFQVTPEIQEKREEYEELIATFQKKFPKENLRTLSLEEYTIGTGANDSFCWWIERGLKPLGYYFPGSARSYLIYWNKNNEEYSKHGKLVKEIDDDDEAMSLVASTLFDFVNTQNFDKARKYFGDGFLLKLMHSYYPNKYSPINSKNCLDNILKLLGVDNSKMNTLEKNLEVQRFFREKRDQFKTDVTNIEFMEFLFDNFDLHGTISLESNEVISKGESKIIQFHPAYSYEDFVRGITAKANSENQIEYKVENRIIAELAQRALSNPSANYVLIIDEINRANLPAVLGELIYLLEYRFDENESNATSANSMYALEGDGEINENNSRLTLPKNLFIIGTMNTADRSVGHIDYAIRRRFAFVEMLPQLSVVEENGCPEAVMLFKEVISLFCKDLAFSQNGKIERSEFLSPEFRPEDVMIGHSYFLEQEIENLRIRLRYEIKPILKEYLKDGVFLEPAEEKIEGLNV